MVASEQGEDEFAPSKKGLNIAAVVGVIGAILCLLLPPVIGLINLNARWPAAVASSALSFSATAYLGALLAIVAVFNGREQSTRPIA
jgi:membrane protein YdbS with pleckstrin-like domain